MFNLFRKKQSEAGVPQFLPFSQDIHSHILAGIDDGSPDIETSLKLVRGLQQLGIQKTVATPHIIGDLYRNTPEIIGEALQKLKLACQNEGIDVEITAAAEYMMDDYFLKLLRGGSPLLPIYKNIILTEQSYASPTDNLNEITFELMSRGYRFILAHPERYFYYHNRYEEFSRLKDMGFMLQINLLSLTGYYGKPVARAARYIIENDLVDFAGTDMHHERHLSLLLNTENRILFNKYFGHRNLNDLSFY
jgi:tyrosine-protein phosphatase YwqE